MKQHIQTESEWQEQMSIKILKQVQYELYIDMPFMKIALSQLMPKADERLVSMATDGKNILYSPQRLIEHFKENERYLNRAYLHSIIHCLFFHLWTAGKRKKHIWDVACDIMVEYTIDSMGKTCTKRILSYLRKKVYDEIREQHISMAPGPIYVWLTKKSDDQIAEIGREFFTDDHALWPKEEEGRVMPQRVMSAKKQWEKISRQTRMEKKRSKDTEENGESVMLRQLNATKNKRSYREFLKKFSVLREELSVDMDSFDLGYYSYGLSLYKKMPLIEPLETCETYKIRDFVIVLDTSYSVSSTIIEKFLHETFTILRETDSFFVRNNIRIIQCDDRVRYDEQITDINHIERVLSSFTMIGGGGTDFRPAFDYVSELLESGQLKNLCGLIYFTDGKGIFPVKCPPYKCAFVTIGEYEGNEVPVWAMKTELDTEELA